MTDTTTEPVAVPATTTPPDPPAIPTPTSAPSPPDGVAHTPGGIPVLPLTLAGTNSTISAVSTVTLVGGGPVALAVVGGSAVVLGTAAAVRARRRAAQERRTTAGGTNTARGSTQRSVGAPPRRGASAGGTGAGGRGRSVGLKSRTGSGTSGLRSSGRSSGRHAARPNGRGTGASRTAARSTTGGFGGGRLEQVRALRQANRAQTPTRSAARQQQTAARRSVADARRDARAAARQQAAQTPGRGIARRAAGWAANRAASGTNALINRARDARDRRTGQQVADRRSAVRKAPARRRARWGLLRSAARFQGRRLLAALAAGAAGLLGCATTPLGRWLGWRWLMHPGRRLYRRLMDAAHADRARRDGAIRARRAEEEAAADRDLNEIGDRVARPARIIPTAPTTGQEVVNVSGFKFEEAAAEMENAARSYEPDGNMEVLTMIENLPTALLSVANTFRILAERSDEEFAFEKDIAGAFDDIHQQLLNGVDAAETLVPLFRNVHEQDIARHESPRNGSEAEKGWNV